MTKISNSFSSIVFGIPEKSKHSVLKYNSHLLDFTKFYNFIFCLLECFLQNFWHVFQNDYLIFFTFFFFSKRSSLEVMFSNFWLIWSCSRKSCCYTRIFSWNAKNDEMLFSLLTFSSCPLARVFCTKIG